jgi:two-component system NtrC family sensor kinase
MIHKAPWSAGRPAPRGARHLQLVASMLVSISVVTGLAWWDSRRESEAVLRDVGREQSLVASIVALDLRAHLATVERNIVLAAEEGPGQRVGPYDRINLRAAGLPPLSGPGPTAIVVSLPLPDGRYVDATVGADELLGEAARVERPGEFRLFMEPPDKTVLYSADGGVLSSSSLREGLDRNDTTVRLSRPEAADIGLVSRMAMAGLAHVDAGALGRWGVIAVGTAARQRDRETRALWRLVLGVSMATGLVLAFGGIALRNQRRELKAEHDLAVAEMERKRDDDLVRADRTATMGTFAMGVVHEVATPLGVILGRAEQLRARAGQDDRSVHAAQAIVEQVDRIQRVTRRFLDMARGGPPSLTRTKPSDVIRSATALVEHRFAKAGVSLSIDVIEDPSEVLCDRGLLEQALVNLLLNACDACTSGEHVKISARSDAEQVVFVVNDDGVGIDPKVAEHAKEPFFTTKAAGAGTGLGLAIASEIAKSHRGELSIAPNGERGTRACIEIPVAIQGDAHVHR